MALYADKDNVSTSNQPEKYGILRKPGEKPPNAGIYKCQTCGFEDVFNRACETIPPCAQCKNKTEHWKLLVTATDK